MARVTAAIARQRLSDVPEDKKFWCHDGRVMKSLEELESALRQMQDDTYLYHCNETKCDFSNWIKDVIGDEKLAVDLAKSTTHEQAANAVASRIIWLVSKMNK